MLWTCFFVLFALFSLWICISVCFMCLYVFLYACVCLCVFFHLNGIFYAVFVPFIALFYRTYVLILQYLALYGIICLQLNSGCINLRMICPRNPILVFFRFLFLDKLSFPLAPCESPTGFFFFCLRHCMGKFGALDKAASTPPQCSPNAPFNAAWLPYS